MFSTGISDRNIPFVDAILKVFGEADVENLEPESLEQMVDLYEHPLDLNSADRADLENTGLFTSYQLSSLLDYRERHGDVLTLTELSMIDGFTCEIVRRLAPFIHLAQDQQVVTIAKGNNRQDCELAARTAYKDDFQYERTASYAVKYRMSLSDRFNLSLAASKSHGTRLAYPDLITGNCVWKHRYGKVILGDYNARFGQGLCVWNTMFLSGYNHPSSFMKKPSGISPSNSFTGSIAMTGVASEISFSNWHTTLMLSAPGLKNFREHPDRIGLCPMFNVSRYFRSGHISMTHLMTFSQLTDFRIPQMKTSIDASLCFRGVNVFGEVMYDWIQLRPASLAGIDFRVGDRWCIAGLARYGPLTEGHEAAVAGEFSGEKMNAVISFGVLYSPERQAVWLEEPIQMKFCADLQFILTDQIALKLRLSERLRTWEKHCRTEVRVDCSYDAEPWFIALRMHTSSFARLACLGYVETGYLRNRLSLYLRFGMFAIDSWDDRIYVYERDAPGNFNVPAFYRRGFWTSTYLSWKCSHKFRLYFRISYKKPGKAELKLQSVLHF